MSTIPPAELVLLYSDGLVEAHNTQREMFGFPRLRDRVAAHPAGDGTALIAGLLAGLRQFTGAAWEQEDDLTLVALQHCATSASIAPCGESDRPAQLDTDRGCTTVD